MNSLFFSNCASNSVDSRYPVILVDYLFIRYDATNYIQLSSLASDDKTPYNKLKYSYITDVKASNMLRKQLRIFTDNAELENTTLITTVTDEDGYSTTKTIKLLGFDFPDSVSASYTHTEFPMSINLNNVFPTLPVDYFVNCKMYIDQLFSEIRNKITANLNSNTLAVYCNGDFPESGVRFLFTKDGEHNVLLTLV